MPTLNQDQASSITYTIRALRPAWAYEPLMAVLTGLSLQGKPVEGIVLAAFRAAQDGAAKAPTAITWEQYWTKSSGGNTDNGVRLCVECCGYKPIGLMTTTKPPFTCVECVG